MFFSLLNQPAAGDEQSRDSGGAAGKVIAPVARGFRRKGAVGAPCDVGLAATNAAIQSLTNNR